MITGHTDTKPIGPDPRWITDPLTPTIRGGRLYGLGSADMKGAVAAMLSALWCLQPDADSLRAELVVVLTADEEAGSRFGAHYLAVAAAGGGRAVDWERAAADQPPYALACGLPTEHMRSNGGALALPLEDVVC